jgi:pimeloyl-ACP methyl ester carboxylesterase
MPEPKAVWDRVPIIIQFAEQLRMVETYGFAGTQGHIYLEGQLLRPQNRPCDTLFVFMHPSTTQNLMPMPSALADAGLHVLCAASRYPKNDSALIMEKVVYDLGMYIRYAKEQLRYKTVVLVGWSGGGSLSLFYQSQAEQPSITHTPAGDSYDLTAAKLPLADGIVFIAAHLSRAETLTEWMDPSVRDEVSPDARDIDLDIYGRECPNQPPYGPDFVARFREAQRARNRRITDWVLNTLEFLKKKSRDGETERGFVVHRTMCDVRWLDTNVDPNGRKANWCYLGEPRVANTAPAGLARFCSLRSWLSQWSLDHSNGKGTVNARRVHGVPILQIENGADDCVPATHNPIIRDALAVSDKEYVRIEGATHYYVGQSEKLAQCIQHVTDWCARKGFLP